MDNQLPAGSTFYWMEWLPVALDVYVMSLRQYLLGDFSTTLEQLYGSDEVQTLGLDGKPIHRKGIHVSAADARLAANKVDNSINRIKRYIQRDNPGVTADWRDEGNVVYRAQGAFEALQTYAKWIDCQDKVPAFDPPPNNNYYNHPVRELALHTLTFPHLIAHSCFSGYLLPVAFENVALGDTYTVANHWTFHYDLGSSLTMFRELEALGELIGPEDLDAKENEGSPRQRVWRECKHLSQICQMSIQHGLPVIFNG